MAGNGRGCQNIVEKRMQWLELAEHGLNYLELLEMAGEGRIYLQARTQLSKSWLGRVLLPKSLQQQKMAKTKKATAEEQKTA